jgi:hypothetical protein
MGHFIQPLTRRLYRLSKLKIVSAILFQRGYANIFWGSPKKHGDTATFLKQFEDRTAPIYQIERFSLTHYLERILCFKFIFASGRIITPSPRLLVLFISFLREYGCQPRRRQWQVYQRKHLSLKPLP